MFKRPTNPKGEAEIYALNLVAGISIVRGIIQSFILHLVIYHTYWGYVKYDILSFFTVDIRVILTQPWFN